MSAESSKRVTALAAAMLDHPDAAVRSLAGSVLRQFEKDDSAVTLERLSQWQIRQRYSGQSEEFWKGFWAGMWACAELGD